MVGPEATPSPLAPPRRRRVRVLPGFGLSLTWTVAHLLTFLVIPLAALLLMVAATPLEHVAATLASPRTVAALSLSFGAALTAASIAVPLGLLMAWVLTRYDFPGRRVLDAMVDLPFALPTAVSGIALTFLYSPRGWIGSLLAPLGIQVAFTRLGIVLALIFVGFPFVVRTVQPLIEDLEREAEEAAATLGATPAVTFRRVILPALRPALLTGFALAFARGVGEYGSVIFIAGNMPMQTEIAPLLIVTRLEQYDYQGAAVLGVAMLVLSFLVLFALNLIHRRWGTFHARHA
jgi:sulfate/thiosulfate transport system permease protein